MSAPEPSEPPSALEQRRTTLRDKLKAKLGAIKLCPKAAVDYDRSHYVRLIAGTDGKIEATSLTSMSASKLGGCFAKSIGSIKIPTGEHSIRGMAVLRFPKHGKPSIGLTIEPDPSELKLPASVRRLACACGSATSGVVCAIECRSGSGPTGPIVGVKDPDPDWDKNTAPAAEPFDDKRRMPSAPKKTSR
jgi:hypothetical protein